MNSSYLIGYDLNRPRGEDDYPKLIAAIKELGSWWHCLDSTWIVKSSLTSKQIRDALSPFVDSSDELLIVLLTRDAAWVGMDQRCSQWLEDNL